MTAVFTSTEPLLDRLSLASRVYTSQDRSQDGENIDRQLLPLHILLPVVIVISLVVMVGIVGNLLVLLSYVLDPRLRTVSNLYLCHLAVVDLLLAAFSMPFYLVSTCMKLYWPFGNAFCKVFQVIDYTLCCNSVLLVILVSLDQFLILRKGVNYSTSETRRKVYAKLTCAWLFAFLLYGPAIIGWDIWRGYSVIAPGHCNVEFLYNEAFEFFTVSVEFGAASVALISLNLAVYWEIRKRTRVTVPDVMTAGQTGRGKDNSRAENIDSSDTIDSKGWNNVRKIPDYILTTVQGANGNVEGDDQRWETDSPGQLKLNQVKTSVAVHSLPVPKSGSCKEDGSTTELGTLDTTSGTINARLGDLNDSKATTHAWTRTTKQSRLIDEDGQKATQQTRLTDADCQQQPDRQCRGNTHHTALGPFILELISCCATDSDTYMHTRCEDDNGIPGGSCNIICKWITHLRAQPKYPRAVRKDMRAAKALFFFVFTFLLLWAPFSISAIIKSFCKECVHPNAYEFFVWLLWSKCAVDPFVYAANNTRFKRNFIKIFRRVFFCWGGKTKAMTFSK